MDLHEVPLSLLTNFHIVRFYVVVKSSLKYTREEYESKRAYVI